MHTCGPLTLSSMMRAATSIRQCSPRFGVKIGMFALCSGMLPPVPQPINPGYGDYHGLEQAPQWWKALATPCHQMSIMMPSLISETVMDANLPGQRGALKRTLPTRARRRGRGPTGVTMTGKTNSVLLRERRNCTMQSIQIARHSACLFPRSWILPLRQISEPRQSSIFSDGLYCARRHQSYPLHFRIPLLTTRRAVLQYRLAIKYSWLRKMV